MHGLMSSSLSLEVVIAGTTLLLDQSELTEIQVGDKLTLQRENGKFDEKAILLFTKDKKGMDIMS